MLTLYNDRPVCCIMSFDAYWPPGSLTRRRVRREVADIEHGPVQFRFRQHGYLPRVCQSKTPKRGYAWGFLP